MATMAMEQRKRIHPHKFTLWVAIGSILMMFMGFTSAYIVKHSQANWFTFELPKVLWYSTAVIITSSVTMWVAEKKFKQREMQAYKGLITATLLLGVLFLTLQVVGFFSLYKQGLTLQRNSVAFLIVIAGCHAVHVLGGVIALMVIFIKAFSRKERTYNTVPVEVMSTYWHFVDILWVYLLVFLLMIR